MIDSTKKYLKMIKTGEFFYKLKNRICVLPIKNKIIQNKILEYKEYRRLKRKYYKLIENRSLKNNMKSSNKVWVFWYQGLDSAPMLVKKCIESIKKTFKNREIVILTKDNYSDYVKFPDYIMKKFNKGIITFTHFSDLLRIELLSTYGGIWCDSTLYFTDSIPDYVENADLFVFKNIDLDRNDENIIEASNWFISCKANNDIIVATRDLLYEYYKHERFIKNYFFFHIFFGMVVKKFPQMWEKVPTFSNINPHILQFEILEKYDKKRFEQIKRMSFVHKLNKVIVKNNKSKCDTFYDFIVSDKKKFE